MTENQERNHFVSPINNLKEVGTVVPVIGDGNCGYYAVCKGLVDNGLEDCDSYEDIGLF